MGSIIQYLLEAAVALLSLLVYWLVRLFAVSTNHSFLLMCLSARQSTKAIGLAVQDSFRLLVGKDLALKPFFGT